MCGAQCYSDLQAGRAPVPRAGAGLASRRSGLLEDSGME